MLNNIFNKIKLTIVSFVMFLGSTNMVFAQEITAIDFNGDLIGKVIPDGTAISFDNAIIGNVTADSFIVNGQGEIIGGVVPQGVVIGNDNKLLGKVNNDGSVRLPSGKVLGKVLPNGLVVDDVYNILGAVLYPGLVYNNDGRTVGRLTGDGIYASIEGQNVGFVSPLGYAYRNSGTGFTLDGKLISSKMVISLDGKFIGSVAPGGKVTDFSSNTIGSVHANGYVYNENNQIIGQTVSNGYAFDNLGKYLGLVSYNGEVIAAGSVIGHIRGDGRIIDNQNNVMGFALDIASTATDLSGKYLGRLLPNGKIAKARDIVGTVGARGLVFNDDGEVIGRIIKAGPIYDYQGNLIAQGLRSGSVISMAGAPLGYMKDKMAYDNLGRLLGASLDSVLVMDSNNNTLGLSGIGTDFVSNGLNLKVSPFGYVYASDYTLSGRTLPLTTIYNEAGIPQIYLGADGLLQNVLSEKGYKLTQFGYVVAPDNNIIGSSILPYIATGPDGQYLGHFSADNLLIDKNQQITGKAVPEYKVITTTEMVTDAVMPVQGSVGKSMLAVSMSGGMLGYADFNGVVRDYSGNTIGSVVDGDIVVDTKKSVIGKLAEFNAVVNNECSVIGVVGSRGEVRNNRDIVLGRVLANGQVISEVGEVIGFSVKPGAYIDDKGNILGMVNTYGKVLNYNRENVGCVRWNGRFYNSDNVLTAHLAQISPVMNFENLMIGRVNISGQVVNDKSRIIGYTRPDGSVISEGESLMGVVFKYKFAFSDDNSFLGRVLDNGNVVSDTNDILGQVQYDGTVVSDNKPIGYALYDLYVYDENGKSIGYLNKSSQVMSFSGNRLGQADKGFLIDKDYNLIGRGNRDYFIRDNDNKVIGELQLNGSVWDNAGNSIGNVTGSGEVRNSDDELLAQARPLQYYNVRKPEKPKPAEWAGTGRNQIDITAFPEPQEQEPLVEDGYGLKAIGIALTPDGNYLGDILANNDVVDKSGNLIGKKMTDGLIVDADGNLIGIEDAKNTSGEQMFVPAGTFGSGGAYGTGNNPTNLGPGGGFGPGERYDPVRSAALAAAQSARRSEITVGKLSTTVDKNSFDGKQPYWDGVSKQLSTWRVDMSEMILADKPIPAVLARTIMSSNGADDVPVTAIVERNVYAEEGRNIVIPAGSRVMGTSAGGGGSGTSGGAVRVSITWTRLIRPDGSAFEFSAAKTGDAQGRGGALGYLDEQLLKKYTLPMVTTLLTSGLAYITATDATTEGGSGGDSSGVESSRQQAANDARQNFIGNMDQLFNQILQDKTDIEAVTYVPAGTRLIIYPREDLWIRTLERSKEESEQALNEPTVFIDDEDPAGKKKQEAAAQGGGSGGTGGSTSGVVYQDNVDAQATSVPLIDDGAQKRQSNQRASRYIPPVTTTGATPPPPSSGDVPPSIRTSSGNNNSAQLF